MRLKEQSAVRLRIDSYSPVFVFVTIEPLAETQIFDGILLWPLKDSRFTVLPLLQFSYFLFPLCKQLVGADFLRASTTWVLMDFTFCDSHPPQHSGKTFGFLCADAEAHWSNFLCHFLLAYLWHSPSFGFSVDMFLFAIFGDAPYYATNLGGMDNVTYFLFFEHSITK